MITGEERLRENLADLYGNVIFYDGRPSQTQVERTDVIARELADVVRDFDAWSAKELGGLNTALGTKQLEPIRVLTREQWQAKATAGQERSPGPRVSSRVTTATGAGRGGAQEVG